MYRILQKRLERHAHIQQGCNMGASGRPQNAILGWSSSLIEFGALHVSSSQKAKIIFENLMCTTKRSMHSTNLDYVRRWIHSVGDPMLPCCNPAVCVRAVLAASAIYDS